LYRLSIDAVGGPVALFARPAAPLGAALPDPNAPDEIPVDGEAIEVKEEMQKEF
jgi:hypothetical protein